MPRSQSTHDRFVCSESHLLYLGRVREAWNSEYDSSAHVRGLQGLLPAPKPNRPSHDHEHYHSHLLAVELVRAGAQLHREDELPRVRLKQLVCQVPVLSGTHQGRPARVLGGPGRPDPVTKKGTRGRRNWLPHPRSKTLGHR